MSRDSYPDWFGGGERAGFMLDRCHDELQPGDVVVTGYRGDPEGRFTVLRDTGTGMWEIRDPDGVERPIRPSTLLSGGAQVIRASATTP